MGSVEAAIPCDDWPLRRTLQWNELGPKAKERGTERLWSGWESGAGAETLFNRELSIAGFFQILCLWLCCPAISWPLWFVFTVN